MLNMFEIKTRQRKIHNNNSNKNEMERNPYKKNRNTNIQIEKKNHEELNGNFKLTLNELNEDDNEQ